MKNISALLVVVLLATTSPAQAAQESQWGRSEAGDLPPAAGGSLAGEDYSSIDTAPRNIPGDLEPIPEPQEGDEEELPIGKDDGDLAGSILGEPLHLLQKCPSYFESSGTWLNRGYWYGEADYLLLNRGYDRKGLLLGSETALGDLITGDQQGFGTIVVHNELRVRGQRPGGEGNARVKLGRFLFRDSANRDHLMEAGYYGGGDWHQDASLSAATPGGLQVPDYIDRVNPSFDDARGMSFSHDTQLHSGELNYLVKQRMHRDQMVMQPSGEWVRKATPSRTLSYLAGVRYVNLHDVLDYDATDIPLTGPTRTENGFYDVETDNNLFGSQLGLGLWHETARWSIGINGKAGAYLNRIHLNSRFQVGESTLANSGVTNVSEDDLAFVSEASLLAKWHLRPNLSLRAGLEVLFIDSVAVTPFQVNFIRGGYKQIALGSDNVFLGTSFGLESHW